MQTIKQIIVPPEKNLGEFTVRRALPHLDQQMVGPWIFFDEMGPANFSSGTGINVRPHPHINLATVTYLFTGEILHRDSLGSEQVIQPGDINLMVAGSGIVHSERERPEVRNQAHQTHGLQLWLALPEDDEEIEPAFYHYPQSVLPIIETPGITTRIMMGKLFNQQSPVKTFAQTYYYETQIDADHQQVLPPLAQQAIYLLSGTLLVDNEPLPTHAMAIIKDHTQVTVEAKTDCRFAVIGGEKMSQRYIEWNFVSSSQQRINQAKQDWRAKRFPLVINDSEEYIPLPD